MTTYAQKFYAESEFGMLRELPKAGVSLENPYAYDATAKELKRLADEGLIRVLDESNRRFGADELIDGLKFMRLR